LGLNSDIEDTRKFSWM